MITIDKLRIIAKAKLSDKSKLGNWYTDRLELCSGCPFNSVNKSPLSVRDMAIVAANFGQPSCLGCGCGITAKASVRASVCGLEDLGMEPVWTSLPEIESHDISKILIENYSSDKVRMINGVVTQLNYGNIKYNSDTEITISLEGKVERLRELKVAVSCGCTSGVVKEINGKSYITLKYDSKRLGYFKKPFSIKFLQGDFSKSLQFKLEGTVIK